MRRQQRYLPRLIDQGCDGRQQRELSSVGPRSAVWRNSSMGPACEIPWQHVFNAIDRMLGDALEHHRCHSAGFAQASVVDATHSRHVCASRDRDGDFVTLL
jgi:hypothetical protein